MARFCKFARSEMQLCKTTGKRAALLLAAAAFKGATLGPLNHAYSKWGFTFEKPIALQGGENHIALLSMTVGFQNIGAFFDTWPTGIDGPVKLPGLRNAPMDLSFQTWSYQVAELVRNAVPLALTAEDDPRRQEMERLQKEKEEIDRIAHKHIRRVLWSGLGSLSVVTILFFRLTFWEFSWDVMEPIAFFGTTGGLIVGYLYFLVTSRDPTYQDFMKRLFLRRRRKLCKKRKFDVDRFLELQKQCKSSLDSKRDLEALVGDSS